MMMHIYKAMCITLLIDNFLWLSFELIFRDSDINPKSFCFLPLSPTIDAIKCFRVLKGSKRSYSGIPIIDFF